MYLCNFFSLHIRKCIVNFVNFSEYRKLKAKALKKASLSFLQATPTRSSALNVGIVYKRILSKRPREFLVLLLLNFRNIISKTLIVTAVADYGYQRTSDTKS